MSAPSAEVLDHILQLSQVKEENNTAPSEDLKPAHEHAPLPFSALQMSQAKDEDITGLSHDSKSAEELVPVHPSFLQLSQVKDEDITALPQNSKPLHDLALLLPSFETINWIWNSPIQKALSSNPPIHRLLLTLLANPDLAALVKHLSFSAPYNVPNQGATPPIQLNEREMKAVQDMILEAQLPMEPAWTQALELGSINVFVALVLSQLHNLQTLHLDADFFTETKFLGLLFKHALLSGSAFPALYHVRFALVKRFEGQGMKARVSMDRDQVKALFYLQAIEIIEAVVFQQETFNWPTPNPPIASNLKILKLPLCELDENGLQSILSATPNLEILTYERWCDIDPLSGENWSAACYDLIKLDLALTKVKEKLQRLSLSVYFYANTALEFDNPDHTFGIRGDPQPYHDYVKLEYLEISFVILFGYDQTCTPVQRMHNLLPLSLRHLYLKDDMAIYADYAWDAQPCLDRLKELIAGRDRLVPHLESITLRLRYSTEIQWDESEQEELKSLCAGAGLTCTIDKDVYTG